MSKTVSIIICTRNRAADLRLTLDSMRRVAVPDGALAELVVVDNGSTDDTAAVVSAAEGPLQQMKVRRVIESEPGLSNARNCGLASTSGDVIVFTDDDVRFPDGWLSAMCAPIWEKRADAVAGGVNIAPHLLRPWMQPVHRRLLASTEGLKRGEPGGMVGANMAFARHVLERVPGFDPELGAGRLGFGEEGVFADQLLRAGFRIADGTSAAVEHHFDPARLQRAAWPGIAERLGRSTAYLVHHWTHQPGYRFATMKRAYHAAGLRLYLATHGSEATASEGMSEAEIKIRSSLAVFDQLLAERKRPRNYEPFGLIKLKR